jgi:hypothetical protein
MSSSLPNFQAERLAGTLEDAIERIAYIAHHIAQQQEDSLGGGGGGGGEKSASAGDVMSTLAAQRALEVRYGALVQAQSRETATGGKCSSEEQGALDAEYSRLLGVDGSALPAKARAKALRQELSAVSSALRDGMKHLGRLLHDSSGEDDALGHCAEERAALLALLQGSVVELRRDGACHRLAEHVARERAAAEAGKRAEAREAEVAAEVQRLAGQLAGEAAEHAEALRAKEGAVLAASEQLLRLRSESSSAVRYARKEVAAGGEAEAHLLRARVQALGVELAEVRAKAEEENAAYDRIRELLSAEVGEVGEAAEALRRALALELPAATEALGKAEEERAAVTAQLAVAQARYERELQAAAEKMVRARAREREGGGGGGRDRACRAFLSHTHSHTHTCTLLLTCPG